MTTDARQPGRRTNPPMNLNQVTLPAADVAASVAFYLKLGFTQIVDSPHYARFTCPAGETSFSLHLSDTQGGAVIYFETPELDQRVTELQQAGIQFTQEPTDQRWLWREARLLDPHGNQLCLYYAGENRLNPPWRISKKET